MCFSDRPMGIPRWTLHDATLLWRHLRAYRRAFSRLLWIQRIRSQHHCSTWETTGDGTIIGTIGDGDYRKVRVCIARELQDTSLVEWIGLRPCQLKDLKDLTSFECIARWLPDDCQHSQLQQEPLGFQRYPKIWSQLCNWGSGSIEEPWSRKATWWQRIPKPADFGILYCITVHNECIDISPSEAKRFVRHLDTCLLSASKISQLQVASSKQSQPSGALSHQMGVLCLSWDRHASPIPWFHRDWCRRCPFGRSGCHCFEIFWVSVS